MLSTQMIPVDPAQPEPGIIALAAAIIRQGGLVAFPTETVYGLGADALDAAAVRRIFAAKGRPAHDPLIVHVASVGDLGRVASSIPALAESLAQRFWPGPLTLVLPKQGAVPDEVTAGGATVAVRCPNHPLALALIRAVGSPIAAPSANLFGHTSPTTAQHVWDDLAGRIEMILDGGPTPIGVESTVLDLTGAAPSILRPGGVTREELEVVLGPITQGERSADVPLSSPGLLDRHYAPRAELRLFSGSNEAVVAAMRRAAKDEIAAGHAVGLLVMDEDLSALADLGCLTVALGSQSDLAAVAQRLYDAMRTLDTVGVEVMLAHDAPAHDLGMAIRDRLRRAAQVVVEV